MLALRPIQSILAAWLLSAGCATPVPHVSQHDARAVADSDQLKSIAITEVGASLRQGEVIGRVKSALENLTWGNGYGYYHFSTGELDVVARREFEKAGWPVLAADRNDNFTGYDEGAAEILIAAVLEDLKVNLSYKDHVFYGSIKGEAYLKAKWLVYSTVERDVIATFHTEGSTEATRGSNSERTFLNGAFAASVRNLLASEDFLQVVSR